MNQSSRRLLVPTPSEPVKSSAPPRCDETTSLAPFGIHPPKHSPGPEDIENLRHAASQSRTVGSRDANLVFRRTRRLRGERRTIRDEKRGLKGSPFVSRHHRSDCARYTSFSDGTTNGARYCLVKNDSASSVADSPVKVSRLGSIVSDLPKPTTFASWMGTSLYHRWWRNRSNVSHISSSVLSRFATSSPRGCPRRYERFARWHNALDRCPSRTSPLRSEYFGSARPE